MYEGATEKVQSPDPIYHPILIRLALVTRLESIVQMVIRYSLTIDFIKKKYDNCTGKITETSVFSSESELKIK